MSRRVFSQHGGGRTLALALVLLLGLSGAAWAGLGYKVPTAPPQPSAPGAPSAGDDTAPSLWKSPVKWVEYHISAYNYAGPDYGGGVYHWTKRGQDWLRDCVRSGAIINLKGKDLCAQGKFPAGTPAQCQVMPACGTVDECAFDHDMAYSLAERDHPGDPFSITAVKLVADQVLIACAKGMFWGDKNKPYVLSLIKTFELKVKYWDAGGLVFYAGRDWTAQQAQKAGDWIASGLDEIWGGVKDASAAVKGAVAGNLTKLMDPVDMEAALGRTTR